MKCNTTILWWNKHKQQLERSNPRNGSSLLPAKTDLVTSKQLLTTIRNGGSFEKWLTTIRVGCQPLVKSITLTYALDSKFRFENTDNLGETHGYNNNIVTSASTHNPSRTNQMIILSNSCICCYELNKWSSYRENYHLIWFVHARFDANAPSTPTIFCNFSANDLVFFGQDLHVQRRNKEEASMRKLQ
jgi:hypothetical protein